MMQAGEQDAIIGVSEHRKEAVESPRGSAEFSEDDLV
jgi:hypothetical protein